MFSRLAHVRTALVLCLLTALSAPARSSCPQPSESIEICDLFRVLAACKGQMITVRGMLVSTREFVALGDPECPYRFTTEADGRLVAWPVELDLRAPPAELQDENSQRARVQFAIVPIPFRVLREYGIVIEVKATITGRLELKDVYRHVNIYKGYPYGGGFGHLGRFPGRLVVQSVREYTVSFRDKP